MRFLFKTLLLVVVLVGLPAWAIYNKPLESARLFPMFPSIESMPLSPDTPRTVTKGSNTLLEPINGKYVYLKDMPASLSKAVVAVEDQRFYQHKGIDPRGISRAIFNNLLKQGFVEGGSSITQQLARNLYLSQTTTAERKLTEALLALQLEEYYRDKDKILELYLNNIYFGRNAWGIGSAAVIYFGKEDVSALSVSEAAFLAGLPQSPSFFADDINAAQNRQKTVIRKMKEQGYLEDSFVNQPPKVKAWYNAGVSKQKSL